MTDPPKPAPGADVADEHRGELARRAARAFCRQWGFPQDRLQELDGPPLFGPVEVERAGSTFAAYRWLGGGRGDLYVQAEVPADGGPVVVFGSAGHQELGPWKYEPPDGGAPTSPPAP